MNESHKDSAGVVKIVSHHLARGRAAARYELIKQHRHRWPVRRLCGLLNVSPSGYYSWIKRAPSARTRSDMLLLERIGTVLATTNGTYGARRVHRELLSMGFTCGLHRVERLMRLAKGRASHLGGNPPVEQRAIACDTSRLHKQVPAFSA